MIKRLLTIAAICACGSSAAAQTPGPRVLVVPFENVQREPRLHWLGEAAAVLLADGLNARGVAAITRAERVGAFEQLNLPIAAPLTRATVIKVGQLVGASEVIVGGVKLDGDMLVVEARSIRVDVGRLQPTASERAVLPDLFSIFNRLAEKLVSTAPAGSSSKTDPQPPLDAFENYIKGLLAENLATRASFLEAAIKQFPRYDRAHLALWDVRTEQGDDAAA